MCWKTNQELEKKLKKNKKKLKPGLFSGCVADGKTEILLNVIYRVDVVVTQNVAANTSETAGYINDVYQCGSYADVSFFFLVFFFFC